jgi:hypothetical protein
MSTTKPGNGHPLPNGSDGVEEKLKPVVNLAEALLLPNPDILESTGTQLLIPVVGKPGALEYFRTHPTLRLTLKMVTPAKGELGAFSYAVMPSAEPILLRYKFEPRPVMLYPIMIGSKPPIYKLVQIKLPQGREWDQWNLSKKIALDEAVHRWVAVRLFNGIYHSEDPDPEAVFPDPAFPEWDAGEWLQRSLGAADLIIHDDTHRVFNAIRHV